MAPDGSSRGVVEAGDTVEWTNTDTLPHTVSASRVPDGAAGLDSDTVPPGATFRFVPRTEGRWEYRCRLHLDSVATGVLSAEACLLRGGPTPQARHATHACGTDPSPVAFTQCVMRAWRTGATRSDTMRESSDSAALVSLLLALTLVVAACGNESTGPELDTAARDTFGFVYPPTSDSVARSLHVEWSRGPLQVGASRPFTRDSVHGTNGQMTDLWGGEVPPGDTAVFVIGYDGDKPVVVIHCFGRRSAPPLRCAGG